MTCLRDLWCQRASSNHDCGGHMRQTVFIGTHLHLFLVQPIHSLFLCSAWGWGWWRCWRCCWCCRATPGRWRAWCRPWTWSPGTSRTWRTRSPPYRRVSSPPSLWSKVTIRAVFNWYSNLITITSDASTFYHYVYQISSFGSCYFHNTEARM